MKYALIVTICVLMYALVSTQDYDDQVLVSVSSTNVKG